MIDQWIEFKKRWLRGYSHVGIFTQIIMLTLLIINTLHDYGLPMWIGIFFAIKGSITIYLVGVWDIKMKVIEKETASFNKHNKDLQTIKRQTKFRQRLK